MLYVGQKPSHSTVTRSSSDCTGNTLDVSDSIVEINDETILSPDHESPPTTVALTVGHQSPTMAQEMPLDETQEPLTIQEPNIITIHQLPPVIHDLTPMPVAETQELNTEISPHIQSPTVTSIPITVTREPPTIQEPIPGMTETQPHTLTSAHLPPIHVATVVQEMPAETQEPQEPSSVTTMPVAETREPPSSVTAIPVAETQEPPTTIAAPLSSTTLTDATCTYSEHLVSGTKKRRKRCQACTRCKLKPCGICKFCINPKLKKCCIARECMNLN